MMQLNDEELQEFVDGYIVKYPDDTQRFWIAQLTAPESTDSTKLVRTFLHREEQGFHLNEDTHYHTQYTWKGEIRKGYVYMSSEGNLSITAFADVAAYFNLPDQKPESYYKLITEPVKESDAAHLYVITVSDTAEQTTETRIWISTQYITEENNTKLIPSWLYDKLLTRIKEQSGLSTPQSIESGTDNLIIQGFAEKKEN